MGLTDPEIRAILADDNELSDSSDEELASEEDTEPERFTQYFLQF